MSPLLSQEMIEETIEGISGDSFTVLDFADTLRRLQPQLMKRLVERFGEFGEKRRYTISTYLSNRLDSYSQKPGSLLAPHAPYRVDRTKSHRRPTVEEKKRFGSPWIAVFRRKPTRRR